MEPPDPMIGVVRAAYERGRIRRALRTSAWVVPMVLASFGGCGRATIAVSIGVLLFALTAAILWWGGVGGRAVKPGLVGGMASLGFPVLACRTLERAEIGGIFPLATCVAGGLLSGIIVCKFAARETEERALFLFVGGLVATMVGALGCLSAGMGGVFAMAVALAATTPFGLRTPARRT